MPVRQAAGDLKGLGQIPPRRRQALERALQFVHLVLGPAHRLASVRVFTLPFWRKLSRNSTAGGDPRLGTRVTYMITF